MSRSLSAGTYKFEPLKAVPLPKASGGYRLLAIPTVADRVLQKALLSLVSPHISKLVNSPGSHAYLPRKGLETAVNDVKRHLREGRRSIVQTDIIKFFDNIRAQSAIKKLIDALPDDTLAPLLEQYVGWEISGFLNLPKVIRDSFPARGMPTGLPQGTALAPILANLMLGDADREAKRRGYAMVRYADDLLFLAPSPDLALDAFKWYAKQLEGFNLAVHDPTAGSKKARLIEDVQSDGIEYLGCYIKIEGTRIKVRPQHSNVQAVLSRIDKVLTARGGRTSFPQRIISASQIAEAWISSYRNLCRMTRTSRTIADGMARSIEALLQQRQILAPGTTLNSEQRVFLGFQHSRRKFAARPTRAYVKKPLKPRNTDPRP